MSNDIIRILFVGPHRAGRNPSQRFRMEQYFPYLREQGFACDYSWFISEQDDEVFYSEGNFAGKLLLLLKAARKRLGDVLKANRYDIIFVQREAFMTGTVFFERQFARSRARLIFDFDDAIWLQDTSEANRSLAWLKRPSKTADLIAMSDLVIAGNHFLADYALQFNRHVTVIPTVVDTTIFKPPAYRKPGNPICIGWTGSSSTRRHFEMLLPVFRQLMKKYGDRIRICMIGDKRSMISDPGIQQISWTAANEVADLQQLDIGLMPLPDEPWSEGKCGFKAIQYMSVGIPAIVSPVGVNKEIIQHGVNGFHASHQEAWEEVISILIESPGIREQTGNAGLETVRTRYNLKVHLPVLISHMKALVMP